MKPTTSVSLTHVLKLLARKEQAQTLNVAQPNPTLAVSRTVVHYPQKKRVVLSVASITNVSKATTNGSGTNNTETATRAVAIQVRTNATKSCALSREVLAARPNADF